jgi:DNA-binding response OmpR family regulator
MARILIIDDNESIRALLRQALEQAGHETVEASDGRVGVRLFMMTPFDLVITDMVMPEQEGIESIRQIRDLDRMTPIIAISGAGAASKYLELASELGATLIFEKPIRLPALLEAVNTVTRRVA